MSDLQDVVKAYELLAEKTDCPLHVWLTEAWWMTKWIVASSTAMWILLQNWIWDTIRASVTPVPWEPRSLEVDVCKYLLQVMWIRDFQPLVTSCPGCWRTLWDTFQKLAKDITDEISKKMPEWKKKYKNFESTKIAVMWCIVNWVWEAKSADIWVYIPGNNEDPIMPVMVKWKIVKYLNTENVFSEFLEIVEGYFEEWFKK
jgi:(E)-4-hydroxy-3-methylbut-2-enyl-diphosphate synthase